MDFEFDFGGLVLKELEVKLAHKNLCESSSRKCLDFCPLGRKRDGDADGDHPLNTSPHYHRPDAGFHHDS